MSEHAPEDPRTAGSDVEAAEETAPAHVDQEVTEPTRTGLAEVDDVLASVEGIGDSPVDDHIAVFGDAHDRLRGALDGRTDA